MSKDKEVYQAMYNYKYMLETGYSFEEYASTVATQVGNKKKEDDTERDV